MDIFNPTTGEILKIPSPDLSGYVPYTGATGDVNLNSKNLAGVNTLEVKQTDTEAVIIGDTSGDPRGFGALDIQSASGYDSVAAGTRAVCVGLYNRMGGGGICMGRGNISDVTAYLFGKDNYSYPDIYSSGNGFAAGYSNEFFGASFNYGSRNLGLPLTYNFGLNNISTGTYAGGTITIGQDIYNQSQAVKIGSGSSNNYFTYSSSGLVTKNSDVALEQIHSTGNVLATNYQSVGAEKIANGSFTTNTTGWTIGSFTRNAGGYMQKTADGTSALSQASGSMTSAPVVGEYYLFSFDYYGPVIGTVVPSVAGVTLDAIGTQEFSGLGIDYYYINKTFSYIIKATATTGPAFTPSDDFRVDSIDNISLKKITGGDVIAVGRVIQAGTFAEIYVADGSTAQSIASGTTYTKLTAFTTNGSSSNCTADATNDKITITKAGKYLVTCSVSGSDGVAGATFKMALFYDGVEQNNIHSTNKFNAGSEIDTMEMSGILVSAANKDIDVRLAHDAGAAVNFTTQYANLTVTYIGE